MGSFKLGKMTLRSLFKKPETVLYPFEEKPAPEGLRGHIEIDIKSCIMCGICQKRCPTGAITVDKAHEMWTINRFDCIQCQVCVRECPQHCLSSEPQFTKPAPQKTKTECEKPAPTEEELAEAARKEAEKAEKVRKALEAKAAREAAKAEKEAAQAADESKKADE